MKYITTKYDMKKFPYNIAFQYFDRKYYEKGSKHVKKILTNPKKIFKKYLDDGWRYRNPNEWFHTRLYIDLFYKREMCDIPNEENPYIHFISGPSVPGISITSQKDNEDIVEIEEGSKPPTPRTFPIIVTLTSHPKRIDTAYLAIESIYRQTYLPQKIILNLVLDDFPSGFEGLPTSLIFLHKHRNLSIHFTRENYRSATKLIPTLKWCVTNYDDTVNMCIVIGGGA